MVSGVLLTSFFKAKELPPEVTPYSAAVYQPKGFSYEKAPWTDIRKDGKWIRPREFLDYPDPAMAYFDAMMDLYESRWMEAEEWLAAREGQIAFLCWCPSDKAAQRQLKEFGTFICHTGPLGHFLQEYLDVPVWYDHDRRKMYGPLS